MADVFVERLSIERELVSAADREQRPFTVPCVVTLAREGLDLRRPVTFLVGENGSGKSTPAEAIAEAGDSGYRRGVGDLGIVDHWRRYLSEPGACLRHLIGPLPAS